MRVLLTGATGFVGSHQLDRLVAEGRHEVAVLMRESSDPWRIAGLLELETGYLAHARSNAKETLH